MRGTLFVCVILWLAGQVSRVLADEDWARWLERSREEAGEAAFDLSFGVAAIESGHPDQAVFALERVLLQQPWNHRARLELGRAHYLLGEYPRARRAFEAVLAANPPSAVAEKARAWLAAIARQQRRRRPDLAMEVGLLVGADSNVNVATSAEQIHIPALGRFLLAPSARRQSDRFRQFEFAGSGAWPVDQQQTLFLGLGITDRENFATQDYDLRTESLRLGWMREPSGGGRFRLPVDLQWTQVANRSWRRLALAGLEWEGTVAGRPLLAGMQWGTQVYPDSPLQDTRLLIAQAAMRFRTPRGTPLTVSVDLGGEAARHEAGAYNARRYLGLRFLWSIPAAAWRLSLEADWQRALYGDPHPVFMTTRRETWKHVELSGLRRLGRRWSLELRLDLAANDANIEFYSYRRGQVMLGWKAVWP